MKRYFNSYMDEFEIINTIIEYLDDSDIDSLINSNIMLRFHLKTNKSNINKIDRSLINDKIQQLHKQDTVLRRQIVKYWNLYLVTVQNRLKSITDIDVHLQNIVKNEEPIEIFKYCTALWKDTDSELNKKGDDLYGHYLSSLLEDDSEIIDCDNKTKKSEVIDMDNNITNASIGEFLQKVSTVTLELDNVKKQLEDTKLENKKLKENLEKIIDNRDLKKEIKTLNKKLTDIKGEIEAKNNSLLNELNNAIKENEQLKNEIKNISEYLNKFNVDSLSKTLTKNLIDAQTNMNNSLKGGIIENINKCIENHFKNIEEKLTHEATIINTKEETTTMLNDKSNNNTPEVKPSKTNIPSNNGLANILKDLDAIL